MSTEPVAAVRVGGGMDIVALAGEHIPGMARVHVDAWRETYTGIVNPARLSALSYAESERKWARELDSAHVSRVLIDAGEVVGFCQMGRSADEASPARYALNCMYILRRCQRSGWGTRLYRSCSAALAIAAGDPIQAWVLEKNHGARAFYRALGGVDHGRKPIHIGGDELVEIRMLWRFAC